MITYQASSYLLEAVQALLLDDVGGQQFPQLCASVGLMGGAIRVQNLTHDEHVVTATDWVRHHSAGTVSRKQLCQLDISINENIHELVVIQIGAVSMTRKAYSRIRSLLLPSACPVDEPSKDQSG